MNKKRWLSLAVSVALLALIYRSLDLRGLGRALAHAHWGWMIVGQLALIAIKALQGWRLKRLMPRSGPSRSHLGWGEAVQLILTADVMNMVLPSKMGDIAKAWFLRKHGVAGSFALSLTLFEKAYDVLALLLWCALGLSIQLATGALGPAFTTITIGVSAAFLGGTLLLWSTRFARLAFNLATRLAPARLRPKVEDLSTAWFELLGYLGRERKQHAEIAALSIALWLLHFIQLWIFVLALRAWVPFLDHIGLASLAILAGLAPFTFSGLGTRDAALVVLYRPWFGPETAAALGLLFTTRYAVPALAGLPFFRAGLKEVESRGSS